MGKNQVRRAQTEAAAVRPPGCTKCGGHGQIGCLACGGTRYVFVDGYQSPFEGRPGRPTRRRLLCGVCKATGRVSCPSCKGVLP
jgi:hypothetical protein